jgi:hypothetical protein
MRVFVATVLAMVWWSCACAADYEGPAVVVDGDTIELHVGDKTIPVRLCGIDSPEARHAGGPEASAKMAELIVGKEVQCVQVANPCQNRAAQPLGTTPRRPQLAPELEPFLCPLAGAK